MKAVIYSRVSSNGQSTSRQINELKEVEGYAVVKVYKESVSGYTKSVSERPELQRAINFLKLNNDHVLMVHEVSRLGRRTSEVLTLIDELKQAGIRIYIKSLDFIINGNGATEAINKLIVTLLADLSRMESEQASFRIKSGLQERKRQGKHVGRQFGTEEDKNKFLSKYKKVISYLEKGESIRWIATKMKISPTTVQKVKSVLNS